MERSSSPDTPRVGLVLLDRLNWETVTKLKVSEEQQKFIPDNLYAIAESKFEDATPYGITFGDQMVGFLMVSVFGGVHWINRIMVDVESQGKGIGKKALGLMVAELKSKRRVREIRTSVHRENIWAQYIFQVHGFKFGEEVMGEDEVVLKYENN